MQCALGDGIIERVPVLLFARALRRALPLAFFALAVALALDALFAEVALAQSTGGSFGGGDFGGGDFGGSSSGGGYSGGDVEGDEILVFIVHILLSRLPWPLKIALVGLIGGGWVVYKLFRKRGRKLEKRGRRKDDRDSMS